MNPEFQLWPSTYQIGILAALASVSAFFIALVTAYSFAIDSQHFRGRIDVPPLLWVSTGILLASSIALERARAEEVMVYSIGLENEYFDGQRKVRTNPDRGLRRLSEETGGGFFVLKLKEKDQLGPTFTRVAQELHAQYVLGFTPQSLDAKVHKLEVRVKKPGMTPRARKSYMAAPATSPPAGK